MQQHKPYTPAAKTDVMATWRRAGWVPPSETTEYQDKWKYYRSLYLMEQETCESQQH